MKLRNFTCLILIYLIWLSLFTPFGAAQNSIQANPQLQEKNGLQFRLREGGTQEKKPESSASAAIENLSEAKTNDILQRLPQLAPKDSDNSKFPLRSNTLQPPKAGKIILTQFPADEKINAPDVSKTNPAPLEIVRFTPNGNISIVSDLSVTFSQPMISISSQTEAGQIVPIKLTPEVKGKWRWLGTTTLIFDAETRFPMATKFTATIPAGTKSAIGGTLKNDFSWTFSTPPPIVESFYPKSETVKLDPLLLAIFNQDINPQTVLPKINVTANNQKSPYGLPLKMKLTPINPFWKA